MVAGSPAWQPQAMLAEDRGSLPVEVALAQERLPQTMFQLGYEQVGERTWERRSGRSGRGFWSLPDACPTLVKVTLNANGGETLHTDYALFYRVQMPGQILAHTDAKALELEADRVLALLRGEAEPDIRRERARLVRLTFFGNLVLSMLPALAFLFTVWMLRQRLLNASPIRGILWLLPGIGVWGLTLYLAGLVVVKVLNATVETRVDYRKAATRPHREPSASQS
jgi:hypothetical protein